MKTLALLALVSGLAVAQTTPAPAPKAPEAPKAPVVAPAPKTAPVAKVKAKAKKAPKAKAAPKTEVKEVKPVVPKVVEQKKS